jgi:hypothetical protein
VNKNHEPALQNMRRIDERARFGSSDKPFDLGKG